MANLKQSSRESMTEFVLKRELRGVDPLIQAAIFAHEISVETDILLIDILYGVAASKMQGSGSEWWRLLRSGEADLPTLIRGSDGKFIESDPFVAIEVIDKDDFLFDDSNAFDYYDAVKNGAWRERIEATLSVDMLAADNNRLISHLPNDLICELFVDVEAATEIARGVCRLNESDLRQRYKVSRIEALQDDQHLPEPDWNEWLEQPSWSAPEAAALSLGKDPAEFQLLNRNLPTWAMSILKERLDLIERYIGVGQLDKAMTPASMIAWASKHHIEVPDIITKNPAKNIGDEFDSPHTIDVLHKVLLYLAINHYGFDATAGYNSNDSGNSNKPVRSGKGRTPSPNSKVASSISRDLESLGLGVTDKTIRKRLAEAVEAIFVSEGIARLKELQKARKLPGEGV